jgi:DNA ligase-1
MTKETNLRPMLLCRDNPDTSTLKYPLLAYPKLDGIRCLIVDGVPRSRTMKEIPNTHITLNLGLLGLGGYDGELIVGPPNSETVYRDTVSVVMSHDKISPFTYYVFDKWDEPGTFEERQAVLQKICQGINNVILLEGIQVDTESDLLAYEQECLSLGYEGVILRAPDGLYKQGRTTLKENNTYKLKRFVDGEAEIIGMIEEMENTNEKQLNELGGTKRSTEKAGLVGKGSMGSLVCRDVISGVDFNIGSGFTAEERSWFWNCRESTWPGTLVKYKSFPIGVKDKPRHPIYLGLRDKRDM